MDEVTVKDSPLRNRAELASFCESKGLLRAVEIGVDLGANAVVMLAATTRMTLDAVDPWTSYPEMKWDRAEAKARALAALAPYSSRVTIHEMTSLQAAKALPGAIQFVHVDGAHDAASTAADLEAWWERLDDPGILSGHDWDSPQIPAVVLAFAKRHVLPVWIIPEYGKVGTHPTYYFVKGGG